jgi:hypothetical protein
MRNKARSLHDHHGTWCAHCLRYLGTGEERHHVYPEWSSSESVGSAVLAWTLPVHRQRCHRLGLQRLSDAGGLTLHNAADQPDVVLMRAATAAYFNGNLNLSLVLNLELAQRKERAGDPEASCAHLLNAVLCAGGSSQAVEAERAIAHFRPAKQVDRSSLPTRIRWNLGIGALDRNLYRLDAAAAHFSEAESKIESLSSPGRALHRPAYLRRFVTVTPSPAKAREAVDLARGGREPYEIRTALLGEGWNWLAAGQAIRARESFERVFWEWPRNTPSWWHIADAHFGLGLSYVSEKGKKRKGIGHCVRSQYIRAVLALRGVVVMGVGFGGRDMERGLEPANVVEITGKNDPRNFGRRSMLELRREYIDPDLQAALFRELQAPLCAGAV